VRLFVILIALMTAANSPASDVNEFEGTLVIAFEVQRFTPDSGKGAWWLDGPVPCVKKFIESRDPNGDYPDPVYFHLKIRGMLSDEGHFGHLNGYSRKLNVESVLDCRRIPQSRSEK
jgi:hypothetical protein